VAAPLVQLRRRGDDLATETTSLANALIFTDSSGLAILDNTTVSHSFGNIAPSIWGRIIHIGVLLQGLSHTFPDYQLWERAGRPENREDEFWHAAQQELRNEDKSSPVRTPDTL
jgi:Protein of unknown function (DUF2934)